jgi:hypothetical protein
VKNFTEQRFFRYCKKYTKKYTPRILTRKKFILDPDHGYKGVTKHRIPDSEDWCEH